MEQEEGFIAGIDLGSSSIIGLVGRKNAEEVISIMATESIPSDSCISHGIIYNIDEAAAKVKQLIQKLENKTGKKIGKVYLSLSGMSLKSDEDIQIKKFETETVVEYAEVEKLKNQAKNKRLSDLSVYSVFPCGIYLDGKLEEEAQEKTATIIEARYQLIAGRPDIGSKLKKCFDKLKIDIAGRYIGAYASEMALLDKDKTNAGCMLVDFGGGTTTLSVYKDGFLRYLATIPLGGKAITKDIQAFGFSEKDAEDFKIRYGRVGKKTGAEPQNVDSAIKNMREFNRIIQLRQEEIILNV
ncbi:MAG: pilus assembly protein PilM, partial [Prevotella sp.]|nr:pilus assembly protein PilM [Prevotella sp.]